MLGGKVFRDDEEGYEKFKQLSLNEPKITGYEFIQPPLGIDVGFHSFMDFSIYKYHCFRLNSS